MYADQSILIQISSQKITSSSIVFRTTMGDIYNGRTSTVLVKFARNKVSYALLSIQAPNDLSCIFNFKPVYSITNENLHTTCIVGPIIKGNN